MEFIRFEKSKRKHKKYVAVLENTETGRENRVHFGDNRFSQFRDETGLNIYSNKNHNDKERRRRYRLRHAKTAKKKYSPSWFSWHFLWS